MIGPVIFAVLGIAADSVCTWQVQQSKLGTEQPVAKKLGRWGRVALELVVVGGCAWAGDPVAVAIAGGFSWLAAIHNLGVWRLWWRPVL